MANLLAYDDGTKHDIHDQASALETFRDLLQHLEMLVHKRLIIGPEFLPIVCKFGILFYCQALQMDISKRN